MRSGNVCEWELKLSPRVRGRGPWDVWGLQQVVRPLSLATFGGTLSPCLPLGPSQEDEEGYTLRILTLVSLKGFLVGGLVLEGLSCWGRHNGAGLWSDGWSVMGCLFPLPACACSVAQSCPTLCNPMDSSPPGSCVHGILQAHILEQVAISPSRGPSRPRDRTCVSFVSCIGRWILYLFTTAPPGKPRLQWCPGNYTSP